MPDLLNKAHVSKSYPLLLRDNTLIHRTYTAILPFQPLNPIPHSVELLLKVVSPRVLFLFNLSILKVHLTTTPLLNHHYALQSQNHE